MNRWLAAVAAILVLTVFTIRAQQPFVTTGTITSNGETVTRNMGGYSGVSIQLAGSCTCTMQFEMTVDGSNWVAMNVTPPNSQTAVTSATAAGVWQTSIAAQMVRVRASAFMSGGGFTVTVRAMPTLARGGGTATFPSLSTGLLKATSPTGVVSSVNTSAGVAGAVSDETGSGALVFGTSPTLTTPTLGVATATTMDVTQAVTYPTLVINGGDSVNGVVTVRVSRINAGYSIFVYRSDYGDGVISTAGGISVFMGTNVTATAYAAYLNNTANWPDPNMGLVATASGTGAGIMWPGPGDHSYVVLTTFPANTWQTTITGASKFDGGAALTGGLGDLQVNALVGTGTIPAVSNTTANSCGTTAASMQANSTNTAGAFTVGATAGTSCTLTFSYAAPHGWKCALSNQTTANITRWVPVSTVKGNAVGTMVAGDTVGYVCAAN